MLVRNVGRASSPFPSPRGRLLSTQVLPTQVLPAYEKFKILFCGNDDFSSVVLKELVTATGAFGIDTAATCSP